MRSWHQMPQMAIHRVDEEQFAVGIPIVAPWVGGAVRENLHHFAFWVEAPDTTADGDAFVERCAGNTDVSRA